MKAKEINLQEKHELEQYWFAPSTLADLSALIGDSKFPCFLCAPMAATMFASKESIRVLDIDERFAYLPGFLKWNVYRPQTLGEQYGVLIVDPPFTKVNLGQLYSAVNVLCEKDTSRKIVIAYPVRREAAILATFAPFNLKPTGIFPKYVTVNTPIQFYANF